MDGEARAGEGARDDLVAPHSRVEQINAQCEAMKEKNNKNNKYVIENDTEKNSMTPRKDDTQCSNSYVSHTYVHKPK